MDGCVLELKPAGGGSRLVLMVDCWLEAAVHSMLEEEEHGSSTFVVVAVVPVEDENMAADRNMQCFWEGEGDRNGRLLVVEAADQNWCICVEVFEADGNSTDEHSKTCGFRGGNGKYRLHSCRDCKVTTPNSDNPDEKCEP